MSTDESSESRGIFPVKEYFGATDAREVQQFSLYIADKDRNDHKIDNFEKWVDAALEILTRIGGGASAHLDVYGYWRNATTGVLVKEKTVIAYVYVDPDKFRLHAKELREFIHFYGRETNQGQVLFYWNGVAYFIDKFDEV